MLTQYNFKLTSSTIVIKLFALLSKKLLFVKIETINQLVWFDVLVVTDKRQTIDEIYSNECI